jgi:hypothetical protein
LRGGVGGGGEGGGGGGGGGCIGVCDWSLGVCEGQGRLAMEIGLWRRLWVSIAGGRGRRIWLSQIEKDVLYLL